MTLNPSAAARLEACTPDAGAGSTARRPGVACPAARRSARDTSNVPTLPPGSLHGNLYLGGPESGPITAPPYTIYLDAESDAVRRLGAPEGHRSRPTEHRPADDDVHRKPRTAVQQRDPALQRRRARADRQPARRAGRRRPTTAFTPFTGRRRRHRRSQRRSPSTATARGACASPLPFALDPEHRRTSLRATPARRPRSRSASNAATASSTSRRSRPSLPAGSRRADPDGDAVPRTAGRAKATCSAASQIGTVDGHRGLGPTPYRSRQRLPDRALQRRAVRALVVVPAVAGPFNLGNVVTRGDDQRRPVHRAGDRRRATLPTIVKGIPLRLRRISVDDQPAGLPAATRPTAACWRPNRRSPGSTLAARRSQRCRRPFQVEQLQRARVQAVVQGDDRREDLESQRREPGNDDQQPAGQANIKSVLVQLPKQLPSRLTTLQKACPEATFEANPYSCPTGSFVGGARANTPTLPGKLSGPAILVSHGGAAFPDLDLVLEAERRARDPGRQHQHQERDHHDELRVDARRAGVEHHGEPADRPALARWRRTANLCASRS